MSDELKDIVIVEKPELQFTDLSENGVRMISIEDETYLEQKAIELIEYMRNNHSQDISNKEKDTLYSELQKMWNDVSGKDGGRLNNINFFLVLHRQEYNYLVNLLRNKMDYDVDTIFFAMELDNMIKTMVDDNKFEDDNTAKQFNMTPVDVHYLYQLLSKHTVRGLGKEAYYFAEIIKRIALTSKIFNYYKESYTNIAKAVQLWVASLDKGIAIQENDKVYQLIWGDSDIKPVFTDKPSEEEGVDVKEIEVKEEEEVVATK
jgi:hypothetical protein